MWRKSLEIREDHISKGMATRQVKNGEGLNPGTATKGKDNQFLNILVSKSRVTLGQALGTFIASFLGHWQCLLWGPAFFYLVPLLIFPGKAHMTFQAHPAFSPQVGLRTMACSEDAHVTRIYRSWVQWPTILFSSTSYSYQVASGATGLLRSQSAYLINPVSKIC